MLLFILRVVIPDHGGASFLQVTYTVVGIGVVDFRFLVDFTVVSVDRVDVVLYFSRARFTLSTNTESNNKNEE